MAATQRVFRKGRTTSCIVVYVLWLTVLVHHVRTQSSSTDSTNNTTSAAATVTPTPAPSTAATTQAQTTPAPTSSPQTSFPQNADLGPCPCDLTSNGCDVNCCCDTDCSDSDRLAFSYCLPNSYLSKTDDKVCFQRDVIIIHNTPFEKNTTLEGLFCVYYDNYAKRNYYNIPDVITADDTDRLDMYINRYAGPSFQTGSRMGPRQFPQLYQSGAPIYTVFKNNALGVLGLPTGIHSSVCDDNNPAAYLYGQTSTCSRDLVDLGATCETSLAIRASTYYAGFKVVMNPFLLSTYFINDTSSISNGNRSYSDTTDPSEMITVTVTIITPTLPMSMTPPPPITPPADALFNFLPLLLSSPQPGFCDLVSIDDLYNNSCVLNVIPQLTHTCVSSPGGIPQLCNFTVLPEPRYNNTTGECSDAVTQVEYTITTNGSNGISKVDVAFVFSTLQQSDLPISQTFITQFKGVNETEPVEWSGNPGYVVGQPVRAGQLVRQLDPVDAVVLLAVQQNGTKPEDNSLTILKPSVSGDCSTGTGGRTNVLFGEEMRSGCFISFNMSDMADGCQLMQEIALLSLWPYGPNPPTNWSVATFGNSDPLVVGDWVSILVQNTPRTPVAGNGAECIDMVLGMHIQILYANVGSLANPQAKIVGVSFIYENPQTIAFQCVGAYCLPGTESAQQRFEVVQSVSFVDVSQPAAEVYAEAPLFLAKVPYDFFYPFSLGSGTLIQPQTLLILSALLSILVSTKFTYL